jgi:hypothetical protein
MKIFLKRLFQRKLHKILHRTEEGDKWQYMISNKTLKIEKKKKKEKKKKEKRGVTLSSTLSYQQHINYYHMLIPKISIGLVSNHVLTTGFLTERYVACPK